MKPATLEHLVKGTAITGLALIGSHLAPEMVDAAVEVIPAAAKTAARSEKFYTLTGLAVSYILAQIYHQESPVKSSKVKLNQLEGIVAAGATFAGAVSLGDVLARQVPSLPSLLQGTYEACYTLGGIVTGTAVSLLACSDNRWAGILRTKTRQVWDKVKQYSVQTKPKKAAAIMLALGMSAYPFLPETAKARIHPRTLASRYALTPSAPGGTAAKDQNKARKWIFETYQADLIKAEEETGISKYTLAGLIFIESRGNRYAVSCTGAGGLTQFIPSTAKNYGLDDKSGLDDRLGSVTGKTGEQENRLVHGIECDGRDWEKSRLCRKGRERHCDFVWDKRFYPEEAIPAAARYLSDLMNSPRQKRSIERALYFYSGKNPGYPRTVLTEADRIRKLTE